jgi:hypothetical protein
MAQLGPSRRELPVHYGALMLVNEQLESELEELQAVMANGQDLGMPNRTVAALVHLGHASRHEAPD